MKIKVGNLIIDVISLSKADNTLIIQTNEDVNPFDVAPLFNEQDVITYIDNNGVEEVLEDEFSLNQFEQREGVVTYYLSLPSPLEKAQKKIKELTDALTNVELALCEIYESMEV